MNLYCGNKLCAQQNGVHEELKEIIEQDNKTISKYSWSQTLICPRYECTFFKCDQCMMEKKFHQPTLKHELWRHHKLHHNNETDDSSRNNKKKRILLTSKEDNNLSSKKVKYITNDISECHSIVTNVTNPDESLSCTKQNSVKSNAMSIIAQSNCGNISEETIIKKDDALLQLLLARFTSRLTRYQRHNFCNILRIAILFSTKTVH